MHILSQIFIAIIAGYLAFTNFIADGIIAILPDGSEEMSETLDESGSDINFFEEISQLPSRISNIPDILLKSSAYQQAAVIGSDGITGATTEDPIDAIVNIFCTLTTPEFIRTTTGTGFFIDADGVIMTNAHVAQFLLLETSNLYESAECIVRTGNPAVAQYQAELLYLSPAWIQDNAGVINDAVPLGTGERDYALLYVSDTVSGEPLPATFPALAFDSDLLPLTTRDATVTAAGYPATDLLANGPNTDLLPKKAETTVSELYTFGSNHADVLSIRGSVVGAEGASGGPVVNEAGNVIGMIATRGDDELDGVGSLRAITMSHVEQTISEETGFSLAENLGGNLRYRSTIFAETLAPFLISILEQQAN